MSLARRAGRWLCLVFVLLWGPRPIAAQPAEVPNVSTTTVSEEWLELARHLELLENFDLLLQMDILELMPVLEDNNER